MKSFIGYMPVFVDSEADHEPRNSRGRSRGDTIPANAGHQEPVAQDFGLPNGQ